LTKDLRLGAEGGLFFGGLTLFFGELTRYSEANCLERILKRGSAGAVIVCGFPVSPGLTGRRVRSRLVPQPTIPPFSSDSTQAEVAPLKRRSSAAFCRRRVKSGPTETRFLRHSHQKRPCVSQGLSRWYRIFAEEGVKSPAPCVGFAIRAGFAAAASGGVW
jgi:hypothetical protein